MTAAGSEQGPRQDAAVRRFSGDGTDPETDYRRWRRWSRAYLNVQKAKGIAEDNHGSLLYTLLDGTALATFDSVSMDDIEAPGGHDLLFQVLDERFPEQSTHDKLGKVLDSIFDLKIEKGESTATYTGKVRAAFAAAEAEGIRFPSVAQGYLLLRFLKLSQERKAVVMAAARQSYEEKDVASALRTTYPDNLFVVAKQSANVHVAEASDDDGMVGEELEEDSVLLADYADDDEPIEEQDAIDCLLSWKQTRMGITKEKLNRGFAGGRDFKKLEARVRCFKCKQIGHFSRNCPKRGKGFGENSSSSSTASTTTGSTKVNFVNVAWPVWSNDFLPFGIKANEPYGLPGPPDSDDDDPTAVEVMHMMDPPEPPLSGHQMESLVRGWEYVPRDYWHCTGSRIVREHVLPRRALFSPGASGCPIPLEDLSNVRVTRTVQEDGTTTTIRTINWRQKGQAHTNLDYEWTGETIFFLRDDQSMDPSFKTQRKGCQTEDLVGDMALKGVVEAESEDEDDGETLAALVHDAGYGVVDTGCGRGLVGEETLARHQEALRQHGLEVEELTHVAHTFKYGNGSSDKSIKRVQLPVFIKGRKMSMRVHVVPGNVPLLISKRFLKSLGAQIDLAANTVVFKQAHVTTELLEKRDGSYQLNLIDVQGPPKTSSLEVDVLEAQDIGATPVEEEESFGEVTYSMANDLVMDENSENDQSGNASSTSSNETEAMEESNETPTGDSNMTADYELAENDGEITNSDENNPETIQDRENEGQRSPMSNETDESDEDDMGVMAVFKAEDRRQVQENLFKTLSQRGDEDTPTVMEIFCPGRFSEMAGACGLKSQGSFDMSDGWDWTVREHRERAEMAVELGDPDLLILSPPCGPLSRLQACTPMEKRQNPERFRREVIEAKAMIAWCCKLAMRQIARGRYFLFESAQTSETWKQPCVKKLLEESGGYWLDIPACAVGLRDPSTRKLFGKKWSFLTNAGGIAMEMSKLQCDGQHEHQRVEGTAQGQLRSVITQGYPHKLVRRILCGFAANEHQEQLCLAISQADVQYKVGEKTDTARVFNAIRKLHVNLGHASQTDMMRILKHHSAQPCVLEQVKAFQCDLCDAKRAPRAVKQSSVPRDLAPLRYVGIDVKQFPGWKKDHPVKALNVVCRSSGLQHVYPFRETENSDVICRLYRNWTRCFGRPRYVKFDASRCNLGQQFLDLLERDGTTPLDIPGEAHEQMGDVEVQGRHFETMLKRVLEQMSAEDYHQWSECVDVTTEAKNSLMRRGGYSAHQLVFGRDPEVPGDDLLSDNANPISNGAILEDAIADYSNRARLCARQSVLESLGHRAARIALNSRPRPLREFRAGDEVAVWRRGRGIKKSMARWRGPGIVAGAAGGNFWVAMPGAFIKCSPEQLRLRTHEEREADRFLVRDLKPAAVQLYPEVGASGKTQKQFMDITQDDHPPGDLLTPEPAMMPDCRPEAEDQPSAPVSDGASHRSPETIESVTSLAPETISSYQDTVSRLSHQEREALPESVQRADRLDGHPRPRDAEAGTEADETDRWWSAVPTASANTPTG